jgi:hypothetical protein
VNEGDILTLRVVKINIPERRLGLSLKKVNSAEYLDQDWATSSGDDIDYTPPPPSSSSVSEDHASADGQESQE